MIGDSSSQGAGIKCERVSLYIMDVTEMELLERAWDEVALHQYLTHVGLAHPVSLKARPWPRATSPRGSLLPPL